MALLERISAKSSNPLVRSVVESLHDGADLGAILVNEIPKDMDEKAWVDIVHTGFKESSREKRVAAAERNRIATSVKRAETELTTLLEGNLAPNLAKLRAEKLFQELSTYEEKLKALGSHSELINTILRLQEHIILFIERIDFEAEISSIRQQMQSLDEHFEYFPEFQQMLADDLLNIASNLEQRATKINAPTDIQNAIAVLIRDILTFDVEDTEETEEILRY